MPGMSPRIKAKKGRFADYGQPVVITIVSPASGAIGLSATGFAAEGTAIDPESGDISSRLEWSAVGTGGNTFPLTVVGTGANPTIVLAINAEQYTLTASIPGETLGAISIGITVDTA